MENDPERHKFDDLAARIAAAQDKPDARESQDLDSDSGLARLGSEFLGAVLAGALLGWLVDTGLGTRPWGMVLLICLGFLVGVVKVGRSLK